MPARIDATLALVLRPDSPPPIQWREYSTVCGPVIQRDILSLHRHAIFVSPSQQGKRSSFALKPPTTCAVSSAFSLALLSTGTSPAKTLLPSPLLEKILILMTQLPTLDNALGAQLDSTTLPSRIRTSKLTDTLLATNDDSTMDLDQR